MKIDPPRFRPSIPVVALSFYARHVVSGILLIGFLFLLQPVLEWLILNATWNGQPSDCQPEGACWLFIRAWFKEICVGIYPVTELWRIYCLVGLLCLALPILITVAPRRHRIASLWGWMMFYPILAWLVLDGAMLGLERVSTDLWGGILLSLLIASSGIAVSLPFGIGLALGRRSEIPLLRIFCVGFIELWRAVPLITVLFMSSVMLPLFIPGDLQPDKLLRALIAVGCFASAYMAEVVRGGLQAVPLGQIEASRALGLSYMQTIQSVVLPQALRFVFPGMINNFISLFKDTTLVTIIGMFDLLGMLQSANTNADWLAYTLEGYVFAA